MSDQDRVQAMRKANIGGIVVNMCDDSEVVFQEQFDAYNKANNLELDFTLQNTTTADTIDEAIAVAIEKAFGLGRGWLDQFHLELHGLRPQTLFDALVPIVTDEILCQILDDLITIEDLKDAEHPHEEFIGCPDIEFNDGCIAYRVPDDAMFSPFQSKNFFPCGSTVIVLTLVDSEDIERGDAVLIRKFDTDEFALRSYSESHFYPSNPNFEALSAEEAEVVGWVLYCIQSC